MAALIDEAHYLVQLTVSSIVNELDKLFRELKIVARTKAYIPEWWHSDR